MDKIFSIPFMAIIFFLMAFIWAVAAVSMFGETLSWLFMLLVPANIFMGLKIMRSS